LLTDISHAVWRGALLEMNGGIKTGLKVQTVWKAEVPAAQIKEEKEEEYR
jgi:hypothetical protein